jgi:hypothetical protein
MTNANTMESRPDIIVEFTGVRVLNGMKENFHLHNNKKMILVVDLTKPHWQQTINAHAHEYSEYKN